MPVSRNSTGTAGLTKNNAGTLVLSAANTYNGTTTINAGTLALGVNGTIANSPNIVVGDATSSGAILDVSAKTGGFTIGTAQTLSGIGTVDANASGQIVGCAQKQSSPAFAASLSECARASVGGLIQFVCSQSFQAQHVLDVASRVQPDASRVVRCSSGDRPSTVSAIDSVGW